MNTECPSCGGSDPIPQVSFSHYRTFVCAQCGLSFGLPDAEVTLASFNNYAWTRDWTKDFKTNVATAQKSLKHKLHVVGSFSSCPLRTFLDLGCGNGAYLAAAERLGLLAEGTEIDTVHANYATSQGLTVFHGDIIDYQSSNQWDFIHVKECFHLVSNPYAFLTSVTRLMSPETVLYIDSTHSDGLASRCRRVLVSPPRYGQLYPPVHNLAFNRRSLSRALELHGLRILSLFTFSGGNSDYCPRRHASIRHYTLNPMLDWFFLGGFIGCYATKI